MKRIVIALLVIISASSICSAQTNYFESVALHRKDSAAIHERDSTIASLSQRMVVLERKYDRADSLHYMYRDRMNAANANVYELRNMYDNSIIALNQKVENDKKQIDSFLKYSIQETAKTKTDIVRLGDVDDILKKITEARDADITSDKKFVERMASFSPKGLTALYSLLTLDSKQAYKDRFLLARQGISSYAVETLKNEAKKWMTITYWGAETEKKPDLYMMFKSVAGSDFLHS